MPEFVRAHVDVAIFAMAQRYAIGRYLTGAAESAANSILENVDVIKRDQGIRLAIVREAEDYLRMATPHPSGSKAEFDENRDRWQKVVTALS